VKILISVLLLVFVFNAMAAEGTRIECHGQGLDSGRPAEFTVLATMTAPTDLGNVFWQKIVDGRRDYDMNKSMRGIWDAWEKSPQDGLRYYLTKGNASSFLLIPPLGIALQLYAATEDQIAASIKKGDHRYEFLMQYIREEPVRGDQEISDLLCRPAR
jgi:hypothetical protein